MEKLKAQAPVLFSRRAWGLCAYILLGYFQTKGWLAGEEIEALTQLILLVTGVGIGDSFMRKLGNKKK